MILPTSNLVVSIGSIMAERFLYLPSIGFCVVAARVWLWLGEELANLLWPGASSRRWAILVPAAVLLALAVRTHARNKDWQDDLSLWQSAIHTAPNSFKTHKGYANAIFAAHSDEPTLDLALVRANQALAILDQKPLPLIERDNTLYQDIGLLYRTKGDFLAQRGQPDQAASYYKMSLDVLLQAQEVDEFVNRTSRETALHRGRVAEEIPDVGNFRIYGQLGLTYARLNDWRGMEQAGQHAQLLNPEESIGYVLAATACYNTGRPLEAARKFAEALFIDPGDVSSWKNLDQCLARLGIQPSPIVPNPPSYSLRTGSDPRVQMLINDASHELAQNFAAAKRPDGVRIVRDRAVQKYGVPASVFNDLGKF
jgi:tetratricopeptide (TPR) repeat protein